MSERSYTWRINFPTTTPESEAEVEEFEFVSHNDPGDESPFAVRNQAFLHRLAQFLLVYMLALGLRLNQNAELLWFSIISLGVVMLLAYFAASYSLHTKWARLRIRGNAIYLYSVDDCLQKEQIAEPFPLNYVSLSRSDDGVQLHYHDQVVTLKREDWPEFQDMVRTIQSSARKAASQ